jgi:hypothetical protein
MYNIKIKPIEIENIMDNLIKNPFFTTKDNALARKIGIHLAPLRKKGLLVIANDRKTGESVIFLKKTQNFKPSDVLKVKGRRCSYDFDDNFFI